MMWRKRSISILLLNTAKTLLGISKLNYFLDFFMKARGDRVDKKLPFMANHFYFSLSLHTFSIITWRYFSSLFKDRTKILRRVKSHFKSYISN